MKFKPSILNYIGKVKLSIEVEGILVSVGIMYYENNDSGVYYDSIFFYTKDSIIINVDKKLEEAIGSKIEEHPDYLELLKVIIKNVEPFEETISKVMEIKLI